MEDHNVGVYIRSVDLGRASLMEGPAEGKHILHYDDEMKCETHSLEK